MGAGKTTVAAALAERLRCRMVDLDQFIERREGRAPQIIIDEDGETRFREIETEALREVLQTSDARVIALGGGTWTLEHNRTLIGEYDGYVLWLDAPFELCWQRIEREINVRPLARDRAKAHELYDERRKPYRQGTVLVPVDESKSPEAIVNWIVSFWQYTRRPRWPGDAADENAYDTEKR
jgi:shikimate kinase